MKIGFFADSYEPYVSGVVRSLKTFATYLERRGHEVYIFAPSYPGCEKSTEKVFRFPSLRAPTHPDFTLAFPFAPRLLRAVPDLKLEVIHVHSPFLLGLAGLYCARRWGLPLVFTYHTLYEEYVHYVPLPPALTRPLTISWVRFFCQRCDLVVAPTASVREVIRAHGVAAPVAVIPTGIELERFQRGDRRRGRARFGLGEEELVLLFVGRLGKEKNLDFLFRAFHKVISGEGPCGGPAAAERPCRLLLVAGGPAEGELRALARELGIESQVTFAGQLAPEEVPDCYAAADLFVFPSLTETQGLVLVEAKAAGLPTVAIRAFGVQDVVRDREDGYLTAPDLGEFAGRVGELLRQEELRRRMGEAARRNAQEFAAPATAERLEKAYLEVLTANNHEIGAKRCRASRFL